MFPLTCNGRQVQEKLPLNKPSKQALYGLTNDTDLDREKKSQFFDFFSAGLMCA